MGKDMDKPIIRRCRIPLNGECTHPGCSRPHRGSGYCALHLKRFQHGKDMDAPFNRYAGVAAYPQCEAPNCARKAIYFAIKYNKYYCGAHYIRAKSGRKSMADPVAPGRRYCEINDTRIDAGGYTRVKIFSNGSNNKEDWPLEHRIIMERHIKRPLQKHELVHHKNGVKTDNRIENLELCTWSQPPGQRVADKLKWARELIAKYGDLMDQGLIGEPDDAPVK